VEAIACGDIDIEVGVVHPVETPEYRENMEQHMLKIDGREVWTGLPDDVAIPHAGCKYDRFNPSINQNLGPGNSFLAGAELNLLSKFSCSP